MHLRCKPRCARGGKSLRAPRARSAARIPVRPCRAMQRRRRPPRPPRARRRRSRRRQRRRRARARAAHTRRPAAGPRPPSAPAVPALSWGLCHSRIRSAVYTPCTLLRSVPARALRYTQVLRCVSARNARLPEIPGRPRAPAALSAQQHNAWPGILRGDCAHAQAAQALLCGLCTSAYIAWSGPLSHATLPVAAASAGVYAAHVRVGATATNPYHAAAGLRDYGKCMPPVAHTPGGRCSAAARRPPRRHARASGAGAGAPQQPRRPGERLPLRPPRPPPRPPPPPRLAALRGCTRAAPRLPRPR